MFAKLRSITLFATFLFYAALTTHAGQSTANAQEVESAPGLKAAKYQGVTPGAGNSLPRVQELKNKPGIWVTWPGFMMLEDGSSRVFLQTTQELTYSLEPSQNAIALNLQGASVFLRNNLNPLVTEHFNTPLKRAYLKTEKKQLRLIMELKTKANPTVSQTIDQDGYHYLFVDFSRQQYEKSAPRADENPPK